jgi:hypothetical protein
MQQYPSAPYSAMRWPCRQGRHPKAQESAAVPARLCRQAHLPLFAQANRPSGGRRSKWGDPQRHLDHAMALDTSVGISCIRSAVSSTPQAGMLSRSTPSSRLRCFENRARPGTGRLKPPRTGIRSASVRHSVSSALAAFPFLLRCLGHAQPLPSERISVKQNDPFCWLGSVDLLALVQVLTRTARKLLSRGSPLCVFEANHFLTAPKP